MRTIAVLDGTRSDLQRQARALAGFLRQGLAGEVAAETLLLHAGEDEAQREHLLRLAPTRDVRLLHVTSRRPGSRIGSLAALLAEQAPALMLFPAGPAGTELAARLAQRAGGSVLTGVLRAAIEDGGLVCRRAVFSARLTAHFQFRTGPYCLVADASWDDAEWRPLVAHRVVADEAPAEPEPAKGETLEDVTLAPAAAASDLATARVVVVAGRGAGSREGVARIAAAAARMGAAFAVSRPVAMNGWAPPERLVGVSGMRVAPAVCIVAGASGAPALAWGIEKAGFIVAIDVDEKAPIVRNADAVVLGDAVTTVEALARLLGGKTDEA